MKEEKKKYKKTKRAKQNIQMKQGDKIVFLKQRIEDLKRSEDILIQDLTA